MSYSDTAVEIKITLWNVIYIGHLYVYRIKPKPPMLFGRLLSIAT